MDWFLFKCKKYRLDLCLKAKENFLQTLPATFAKIKSNKVPGNLLMLQLTF